MRWAWAEVDLEAIAYNVALLRDLVAPSSLWAVVKADAYGHGVAPVARSVLGAGATGLCIALVKEGIELRAAGIEAPILILSQQPVEDADLVVGHRLTPTVYSMQAVRAIADSVRRAGGSQYPVHLKIDTGMHRAGARPDEAVALADAIAAHPQLILEGVFTHLAMADEPAAPANQRQLELFDRTLAALRDAGHQPAMVHALNSAGAITRSQDRRDLVRVGLAMYGVSPGPQLSVACEQFRPALTLRARVSHVQRVAAGEGVSYGLRHIFERETTVATVPIGYADGVPRRLFETGGEVLIGGQRHRIVGVVTMDQLMVDCGESAVAVGDDVVLIGSQSAQGQRGEIRVEEWAERLGTIGYEILCGISRRIDRTYR